MKSLILSLLTASTFSGVRVIAASESPSARPNVIFLFADDQRADTIAALGNPVIQTPNLDRLCQQGLEFTRAYMQGGFIAATCVPSRAMLLAGQNLFYIDEKLLRDETWPAAFGRYDCTCGNPEPMISSTSPHRVASFHRQEEWGELTFVNTNS